MPVGGGHGFVLCCLSLVGTNYDRSTPALSMSNAVIYFCCNDFLIPTLKLSF